MPHQADGTTSGCEGSKADVPRKPCCRRRGGGGGALVEPAALAALLYEDGYGYDMRRAILEHTNGSLDVDVGGMYRALRRLEEEGSVESRWGEDGSGPRRREYKVTDRGVAQAEQWLEALKQRRALDGIIIGLLEEGLVHARATGDASCEERSAVSAAGGQDAAGGRDAANRADEGDPASAGGQDAADGRALS